MREKNGQVLRIGNRSAEGGTRGQPPRRVPFLLALALFAPATGLLAQTTVLIDDFSTDQAAISLTSPAGDGTSTSSSAAGTGMVGGERDLIISLTSAGIAGNGVSAFVGSSNLNYSQDPSVDASGEVQWDGPDASDTLDPTGLGGVDLTLGGSQDAIQFDVFFGDTPIDLVFEIFTDAANSSTISLTLPGLIFVPTSYVLPISALMPNLGAGTDLTNVGAVTLDFSSLAAPDLILSQIRTTSLVTATKVDTLLVDGNGDGLANPGDTLLYTVVVTNPDDAFDADATGVVYSSSVDPATALVVGSVTTSQGTVTTGNTAGDTSVAVDLGTIADGGSVTITYEVVIGSPLPPGLTEVLCQGLVTTDTLPGGIPTDDPDDPTTPDSDPTATPVFGTPMIESTKADLLVADGNGNGIVNPGDSVRYTVVIQNTGDGAADGVAYSSSVDANTTLVVGSVTTTQGTVTAGNTPGDTSVAVDVGQIPAMGSVTITYEVVLDAPLPLGVTQIACQGTATGANFPTEPTDDPDTGPDDDPTATPVAAAPVVEAEKADSLAVDVNGDGGAGAGDTVKYTVVITNTGDQDADMATYTSSVDANTTLVVGSVTTTQGTVTAGNAPGDTSVAVDLGTLAVGASVTICYEVILADPFPDGVAQIACQGAVSGANFPTEPTDDPDSVPDDDPTPTPVVRPDLGATKVATLVADANGDGIANAGDGIKYTVTITNSGAGGADAVGFDTSVDANTTLVVGSVTTSQGTVTTGNGAGDTTVSVDVGDLAPAGTVTICFEVTVNDPLPAGVDELLCQGTVSATNAPSVPTDDPSLPGSSDPTSTPAEGGEPDIQTTKTSSLFADPDGSGDLTPGDTLEYTVVITNSGDGTAMAVLFDDTPDPNTALVVGSVATTQGTVLVGNTAGDTGISVDVGDIPADGMVTIGFRVVIDDPLAAGVTQLLNQGTTTGSNFPPVPSDDPTIPGASDPTLDPVGSGNPLEIPTSSEWGLLLLLLSLAGLALHRIRSL